MAASFSQTCLALNKIVVNRFRDRANSEQILAFSYLGSPRRPVSWGYDKVNGQGGWSKRFSGGPLLNKTTSQPAKSCGQQRIWMVISLTRTEIPISYCSLAWLKYHALLSFCIDGTEPRFLLEGTGSAVMSGAVADV
jgi:hypothetical protein